MMNRTIASPFAVQSRPSYNQILGKKLRSEIVYVPALLALHALLALVATRVPLVAAIHGGITLLVGLWLAAVSPRLERVAFYGAYVTGAEVLWRMSKAPLPWEFGKYAVIIVFLLAILRTGKLKGPIPIFIFFSLLLPSLILPMVNVETDTMTDQLSFNLSGPFALMVSVWFFSNIRLTPTQLHRFFLAMLGPIIGVATAALSGIVTAKEEIVFTGESNYFTSGGFGPNQVSAILGLGALITMLWALDRRAPRGLRIFLLAVLLFLLTQSAMTFSRTGLYLFVGGAVLALFFLIQDRRLRLRVFGGLAVLLLVAIFVVLPRLDTYTQGAFYKRFTDTQTTGRGEIISEDLRIFSEHPLFGVGPGQARNFRHGQYKRAAAHSEATRLLSEHGVWGLTALLVLLFMSLQYFRRARSTQGKALTASMTFWSFAFLFSIAMRLVAPSLIFGLTAATLTPEAEPEPGHRA